MSKYTINKNSSQASVTGFSSFKNFADIITTDDNVDIDKLMSSHNMVSTSKQYDNKFEQDGSPFIRSLQSTHFGGTNAYKTTDDIVETCSIPFQDNGNKINFILPGTTPTFSNCIYESSSTVKINRDLIKDTTDNGVVPFKVIMLATGAGGNGGNGVAKLQGGGGGGGSGGWIACVLDFTVYSEFSFALDQGKYICNAKLINGTSVGPLFHLVNGGYGDPGLDNGTDSKKEFALGGSAGGCDAIADTFKKYVISSGSGAAGGSVRGGSMSNYGPQSGGSKSITVTAHSNANLTSECGSLSKSFSGGSSGSTQPYAGWGGAGGAASIFGSGGKGCGISKTETVGGNGGYGAGGGGGSGAGPNGSVGTGGVGGSFHFALYY